MAHLISIGTAVPPHVVEQDRARALTRALFQASPLEVERLLAVFENSAIDRRYCCMPLDWFEESHSFSEKNALYTQHAIELSVAASRKALAQAALAPADVDHIFFVSTTGLATPSIDAHLFNRLGFRPDIRRTPLWGLGCAGGVAGLSRAQDWLAACPDKIALVVAVELCTLTFIRNDLSKSNFIATALFGDGCGAAVLAGPDRSYAPARAIGISDNAAVTWEDSLNVMGWKMSEAGLKVVFSRSIPQIVNRSARPSIEAFLRRNELDLARVDIFAGHPGGAKVLEAYQRALGLHTAQFISMQRILREYGNMSSATVLFVLQDVLAGESYRRGANVLSVSLGPGFSSEMLLGRCT